jgi:hypothetical protein
MPADDYESADALNDVSPFPVDTSEGKHYQVAVPDYKPGGTKFNSYFRHGVPHSSASMYEEGWSQNGDSVALGDDLLVPLVPPDGFVSEDGGVRDHTDGNRIITTRHDHLEVIQGQYRHLVLSNQKWEEEDQDWKPPTEGGEEEPAIAEHRYTNYFYGVTSTTYQPGSDSFAVPRLKAEKAKEEGWDYYDYSNAKHFARTHAAKEQFLERVYAGKALEIKTTVHASKPDWEGDIESLAPGDMSEYTLGDNVFETVHAVQGITATHEATTITENVTASSTITSTTTVGGAVAETLTVGGAMAETVTVGGALAETKSVGGVLNSLTTVGGVIVEETFALGVNEIKMAGAEMVDIDMAGGLLLEIAAGGVAHIDISAAIGLLLEIKAAIFNIEVKAALAVNIDWDLAPFSLHYRNFHREILAEKEEVSALHTELRSLKLATAGNFMRAATNDLTIANAIEML